MANIKLMNKISPIGTDVFKGGDYNVGEDVEAPVGLMVRSAALHDMEFGPELLGIARAGIGVNNIPIEDCSKKGIVVFNTPGANANAVKELAIAALLLASRNITGGVEWAKTLAGDAEAAKLVEKGKSKFEGPELLGKKLGVIGLGAIGVMVANTAYNLGMEVYGYDPYISINAAWSLSRHVNKSDSLKAICEQCDYITIHVPLNPATKGYLNDELFSYMKDGVRIINLSRGEVVDNAAMLKALESGKVAKYVTDFPSAEVLEMPNTVCIPHLGASTPESENNCAYMAAAQLKNYIEYGVIKNSVNLPEVDTMPDCKYRICMIHENIPNMISQLTTALGDAGVNIEHLTNKSKKEMAYSIVDTNDNLPADLEAKVSAVAGILKVRVIAY